MGRGGAAFPTGRKWDAVARQPRRPHYLICNADESEPGTFKDRVIMEGDPFSLIEAMTIAAYATGCEHGYVYLRGEYPLAQSRLENAVEQARERGLLGEDVLGHGFRFDIELRKGAGAYICGEETAIFGSIEGYRGEPRNKPPFPVERGLFGQPTVVNNVETLINVLPIVLEGGPAYAQIGTERSTGPKLFCVSGAVARPGTYEVPFGTTLRELLELAGGIEDLRTVLLGGAAGSFITPDDLDLKLTFEDARAAATTLGSGVVLAIDDQIDVPELLADDRRVHARRELWPVRALPGRHGTPGGGPRASRLGPHARHGAGRAEPDRRDRAGDARRFDLRAWADRLLRGRVSHRAPERLHEQRKRRTDRVNPIELPMAPPLPAARLITLTIDDAGGRGPRGLHHPRRLPQARDRHAHAVLRRDADAGQRVPDLRGRVRKRPDAGAGLLAQGRARHGHPAPTPSGCA